MEKKKKTHKVIDLVYTEDEGNEAFVGTYEECQNFIMEQGFGYEIVDLSPAEFKYVNSIE